MVCSANGHFIRQASGHYEYEGGDTRLVGISSASSLLSLKEALSRVVTKAGAGSTSASGSPEVSPPPLSQHHSHRVSPGAMSSADSRASETPS